MRMFELHRNVDHSGHSGIGIVASGVEFPDGMVVMRWAGVWPTSVVFHEQGIQSVIHLHGHGGDTRLVFLDAKPTDEIELERMVDAAKAEDDRQKTERVEEAELVVLRDIEKLINLRGETKIVYLNDPREGISPEPDVNVDVKHDPSVSVDVDVNRK